MNRRRLYALLIGVNLLLVTGLLVLANLRTLVGLAYEADVRLRQADPPAPTILMVVFDTTRADHTSLCGYDRPTTPTLERLKAEGAAVSCRAEVPGSWTVPSHASYFTGLTVPQHGAHNALLTAAEAERLKAQWVAIEVSAEQRWLVLPLAKSFDNLAEQLAAKGYQTAMVSANPTLRPNLGMAQGFDQITFPMGDFAIPDRLRYAASPVDDLHLPRVLSRLDRDKPLFLFVNLLFPHDPWRGVPDGQGWVPPQPGLVYDIQDENNIWNEFVTGKLEGARRDAFLAHLRDNYDWGVRQNDDGLAALLDELRGAGWLEGGLRLAVVGDHGEFLGEHGLLQHGGFLYEPNTNVPLLLSDTAGSPTLPDGPVSALAVYDFLLHGRLADPPRPVIAHAYPLWWASRFGGRFAERWAAIWEGDRKLVWHGDTYEAFDLRADPGETTPLPLTDEERARLEVQAELVRSTSDAKGAADPDVIATLRAAGYLD